MKLYCIGLPLNSPVTVKMGLGLQYQCQKVKPSGYNHHAKLEKNPAEIVYKKTSNVCLKLRVESV